MSPRPYPWFVQPPHASAWYVFLLPALLAVHSAYRLLGLVVDLYSVPLMLLWTVICLSAKYKPSGYWYFAVQALTDTLVMHACNSWWFFMIENWWSFEMVIESGDDVGGWEELGDIYIWWDGRTQAMDLISSILGMVNIRCIRCIRHSWHGEFRCIRCIRHSWHGEYSYISEASHLSVTIRSLSS